MFYKILPSIAIDFWALPLLVYFTKGVDVVPGKRKPGQRGRVKGTTVNVTGFTVQLFIFALTLLFKGQPVVKKTRKPRAKKADAPVAEPTTVVTPEAVILATPTA